MAHLSTAPDPEAARQRDVGALPDRAEADAFSSVVRSRWLDAVALCFSGLYTLAIYWPARHCGLVSDSWDLLHIGSRPLRQALLTRLSYHFIPGTHLLNGVLWRLLGLRDSWYQLVNLAELALVGAALYLLGRKLFDHRYVAFLAGLLFLSNSSYYEVPLWTGVGNFQSLTALLYLAGLYCALRAAQSPHAAAWSALFAACGLAAFFTYEPAFSLLPVGVVAAATADRSQASGLRSWLRRGLIPGAAAAVAVVVALAVKAQLAAAGDAQIFLPHSLSDLEVRCLFVVRAVIGIFSLRAHGAVVNGLIHMGTGLQYGQPLFSVLLIGWLGLFAAVFLLLVWRGGRAIRFAACWFAIHLTLLSISTVPQSRHYYLAALPAALLSAALLARAAERLVAWWSPRTVGRWAPPAFLAVLPLVLMLPGAKADHDRAAGLYTQATTAHRAIRWEVQQRLAQKPPLGGVTLVNLPAQVAGDGVNAYFFLNGMREMIELATGGVLERDQVRLLQTLDPAAPANRFANGTRYASIAQLEAAIRDLSSITLIFDEATRSVRRLQPTSWQVPERYTRESAPFLLWQGSTEAYLEISKDKPLELLLALDELRPWVAVRFLRSTGGDLELRSNGQRVAVAARSVAVPHWSVVAYEAHGGSRALPLSLATSTTGRIAGVWTFSAPTAYSPGTAPFLTWWQWESVFMVLDESTTLPLRRGDCPDPCELRIEYQAGPGMELALGVDDQPSLSLAAAGPQAPWTEVRLRLPSGPRTHLLHLQPAAGARARIRTLEAVTAEAEPAARRN